MLCACNHVTERERADWIDAIITAIRTARLAGVWSPFLHTCQIALRKLTDTTIYQFLVIMAIISNFLCNIVEAQLNPIPEGSFREKQFMVIDLFFISFFCVELALNMGAHWFWEFWEDKANWLDTLVVLLSVIGIFTSGGSAFTVIRIMRVFRVLRVFKRLASVRLILKALASAVVPVSNAFFIMLLATTIWAILGVNLFDKRSPQFFGNFGAAFFSVRFLSCLPDIYLNPCAGSPGSIPMHLTRLMVCAARGVGSTDVPMRDRRQLVKRNCA